MNGASSGFSIRLRRVAVSRHPANRDRISRINQCWRFAKNSQPSDRGRRRLGYSYRHDFIVRVAPCSYSCQRVSGGGDVGETFIDPSAVTIEPSSVTTSALEVVQRKVVDSPDSIVESSTVNESIVPGGSGGGVVDTVTENDLVAGVVPASPLTARL